MSATPLTVTDLSVAASLVLLLAAVTVALRLGLARSLTISALRMTIQLCLVGLVLRHLFSSRSLAWILAMATVMVLVAGYEVSARQKHRLKRGVSLLTGTSAMVVSSFTVTTIALFGIIQADPWHDPRYAIPILGMLLGNTMTGVAIACDRLTTAVHEQRRMIEARLLLGESGAASIHDLVKDSLRSGLIPTINSMAAAGIVSLPGMMTGQILAGSPPEEAVKYQILIWLLIATGTGFGMITAVSLVSRRLFDTRDRLRLDRFQERPN